MGKKNRNQKIPVSRQAGHKPDKFSRDIQNVFLHAFQFHQRGNIPEAEKLYQTILAVEPDHADSLHLLGLIFNGRGDATNACDLIARAIKINPRAPVFHFNLAKIYQDLGKLNLAIKHYKKAVGMNPEYVEAFENLGVALLDSDDYSSAKQIFLKAIELSPHSEIALLNMGTLLRNYFAEYDDAVKYFDRVLTTDPVNAEARAKKAEIKLAKGEFSEGWKEYHWVVSARSSTEQKSVRLIPFPKWDGTSLQDKRLLITADQGIGDEIMFASCLQDVAEQAKQVVVECDSRLVPLYRRSFPEIGIIPRYKTKNFYWNKGLGNFDFRIPVSGLPGFYRNSENAFPPENGYLQVDKNLADNWREKLHRLKGAINIGISWQGGFDARDSKARSIPLRYWKNLFRNQNITYINLQYGDHQEEIDRFNNQAGSQLHCLEGIDPLVELDNFSALISVLDLVISIDNSTVHIAGAVGTRTWVILPFSAEWRWMYERRDNVWYPSVKLYRPEKIGFDAQRKILSVIEKDLEDSLQTGSDADSGDQLVGISEKNHLSSRILPTEDDFGYALLLNDTSYWYHWGCTCTSLAIHDQLRQYWEKVVSVPINDTYSLSPVPETIEHFEDEQFFERFSSAYPEIIEKIRFADAVYINGEGTLHHISQVSLGLLYLAYIAKTKLGRYVSIINHSCYPDGYDSSNSRDSIANIIYRKVYEQMDYLAVRETVSSDLLTILGLSVNQSFDCLPLYIEKHYRSHKQINNNDIVISGSVSWGDETISQIAVLIDSLFERGFKPILLLGSNAYPAGDDARLAAALHEIIGKTCELVYAQSEQEWLSRIDNAALLVSGRFHHTIAAAFLRTPFLVTESNTRKIEGLLDMLKIPSYISTEQENLSDVLLESAVRLMDDPAQGILMEDIRKNLLDLSTSNFQIPETQSKKLTR